jgi:hypothetical protein
VLCEVGRDRRARSVFRGTGSPAVCPYLQPCKTARRRLWWQYQEMRTAETAQGENEMQLTVPAGEVTTCVVYDYLRLELNEDYRADRTQGT